jgi:photosystem II stability/assembly factor-like uncharacterized protein
MRRAPSVPHPRSLAVLVTLLTFLSWARPSTPATWTPLRSGTFRGTVSDVFLLGDGLHGWIATVESGAMRTEDGGLTWEPCTVPSGYVIHALHFVDENEGWAVAGGYSGVILHTKNGGRTWGVNSLRPGEWYEDIFFCDTLHGWVPGEYIVLRTADGGANWIADPEPGWDPVSAVFVTPGRGWMAGWTAVIYDTRDGGADWSRQFPPGGWLQSIALQDSLHGCSVGNGAATLPGVAAIYHTVDGGTSWPGVSSPGVWPALFDVGLRDSGGGYAVGADGAILATPDAGRTWASEPSGVHNGLVSVAVRGASVWAGGRCGTLLSRTVDGWDQLTTSSNALRAVAFADSLSGIVAGDYGLLLRTGDGGATWSESWIPGCSESQVLALDMQGPDSAWAGGMDVPGIERSTDGGVTWTPVALPGSMRVYALDFADPLHGWCVMQEMSQFDVYHSRNGGESWAVQSSGQAWYWATVCARDSLHAWLGGWQPSTSLVGRTDDGGLTWTKVTAPGAGAIKAIAFRSLRDGVAVSDGGDVFVTSDSGLSWTTELHSDSTTWDAVALRGASGIVVAGARLQADGSTHGVIVGTTGPGEPWTKQVDAPSAWLLGLSYSPGGRGIATGMWGQLYTDAGTTGVPEPPRMNDPRLALRVLGNPARGTARVWTQLPAASSGSMNLYDCGGRRARLLFQGPLAAGESSHSFRLTDDSGRPLASGVYLLKLETREGTRTARVVVLR